MTPRPRRLVFYCGLLPTLFAALLSLYRPALLSDLEFSVYDTLVRAADLRPASGRIVIVNVDERSLSKFGQWPWSREVIAQLINRLRDLGASTVALDMIFAEPDRHDGTDTPPDVTLADTVRQGRVVLGYAMTFDEASEAPKECGQDPLGLAMVRQTNEPGETPFFRATGAVCNLPVLAEAAPASGFLNAAPDPDGILRRVPLLMELNGRIYPGLALTAASSADGMRGVALRVANVNSSSLILSKGASAGDLRSVPLDGKGNLLVRYRGVKRTFPYVSAADVLSGTLAAGAVKDKLVFVGTTALGTREVVATPLDTLFAGVEVQATVADNLLQGDFNGRPEHGVALETQAVIGLGLLTTLLVLRFGMVWGAIGVFASLAIVWGGAIHLLSTDGTVLSPLFPSLAVAGGFGSMALAGVRVERRRADRAGVERDGSQRLMVQTLLSLTGIRDLETGRHSQRTQKYTRVLAEQLANHPAYRDYLTPERIDLLASLAPLHDIGKVGVPDRVLNKPSGLTADELEEMRRHPQYGRDVIVKAEKEAGVRDDVALGIAKDIVYTHHEKWDGTGYPQGLRGIDIPIPGRVMALVDVYDAILTRRLYQPPMSQKEADAFIIKGSGTHFDPAVVDAFVKVSRILHELSQDGEHHDSHGSRAASA